MRAFKCRSCGYEFFSAAEHYCCPKCQTRKIQVTPNVTKKKVFLPSDWTYDEKILARLITELDTVVSINPDLSRNLYPAIKGLKLSLAKAEEDEEGGIRLRSLVLSYEDIKLTIIALQIFPAY